MLESIAGTLGGHALAIILSGMGRDGCEGAAKLAAAGGTILAQDANTSAVWGMPGAIANAPAMKTGWAAVRFGWSGMPDASLVGVDHLPVHP